MVWWYHTKVGERLFIKLENMEPACKLHSIIIYQYVHHYQFHAQLWGRRERKIIFINIFYISTQHLNDKSETTSSTSRGMRPCLWIFCSNCPLTALLIGPIYHISFIDNYRREGNYFRTTWLLLLWIAPW